MYKSKEKIYDYIVKKYNLNSIDDCKNIKTCPEILDFTDIAHLIPKDFDTTELFSKFKCEEINISNWNINNIGDNMFSSCKKLKKIIIPNSVINIGEEAFSHCTRLTSVNIPKSVTSIGGDAFYMCTGLRRVTIPDGVINIDDGAFS